MAIAWAAFYTELDVNLGTACPDVKVGAGGGGIWEMNEVEHAVQNRIKFPYLVYAATAMPSGDWGLTNSAYEVRIEAFYIAQQPSGLALKRGLADVRTKVDAMRAQFLHVGNFTTATILDVDELNWTPNNPALAVFYAKNIPFVAGAVAATCVIGEFIQ